MRIGINSGRPTLARTVDDARSAEAEGFAAYAMAGDSISVLGHAGAATERIRLLTAVVPIFGVHPSVMAANARVAQEASDGRFLLGIGLSHQVSVEGRLGIAFDRPAARMREYLEILVPLLEGREVDVRGSFYSYSGGIGGAGGIAGGDTACAVAALAPLMLRTAGELSAGTILWMANHRAIDEFIGPRMREAAAKAGRPDPEIICSLPVALSDDPESAREVAQRQFEGYGRLPSYRAILDRGGLSGPGDAALIGNEAQLDAELDRLERVGVTLFNAALFRAEQGGPARTREYLASRARERNESSV